MKVSKQLAALLIGWYALLHVGSNYSTIGPFPDKVSCVQVVQHATRFCANGRLEGEPYTEILKSGAIAKYSAWCDSDAETELVKNCWEVK